MCENFVVGRQRGKRQVKEVGGRAELTSYIYTHTMILTSMYSCVL